MHEGLHGLLRRGVSRDRRLVQRLTAFADHPPAHPSGEQRFAVRVRGRRDELRDASRFGHRLRSENHQRGIHAVVREHGLERGRVPFRRRIAEHIDRVVV